MIVELDLSLSILSGKLGAAGIPFISISGNEAPYTIEFAAEATQEQRDAAAAILAAFDPAEAIEREDEISNAPGLARAYFAAHPAAVTFIRMTPAEQDAAIEAMTLAQLRTVIKFLAVAVAALVKREFL